MKGSKAKSTSIAVVRVIAKALEVVGWLGEAAMIVLLIMSWCAKDTVINGLRGVDDMHLLGFEISVADAGGAINIVAVRILAIAGILMLPLMAMIFRNVFLSLGKIVAGKSEDRTPINEDVFRMVREIGIFSISMPVISLVMSVIARGVLGVDYVETSVSLNGIVIGFAALCLSLIVEKDSEGLI